MYRFVCKAWMCSWMGRALEISVLVCACLESLSIDDAARYLSRRGNDAHSNGSSCSTELKASFPIFARVSFYFRTRSEKSEWLKEHIIRSGVGLLAHERTYIRKWYAYRNREQNTKQYRKQNNEKIENRIGNKIEKRVENKIEHKIANKIETDKQTKWRTE